MQGVWVQAGQLKSVLTERTYPVCATLSLLLHLYYSERTYRAYLHTYICDCTFATFANTPTVFAKNSVPDRNSQNASVLVYLLHTLSAERTCEKMLTVLAEKKTQKMGGGRFFRASRPGRRWTTPLSVTRRTCVRYAYA